MFSALVLHKKDKAISVAFEELAEQFLPEEDVLVEVQYSSINYKDALAVTGKGKIVRGDFPFVPGIDLVGRVLESRAPEFIAGDMVIGNGWGLGEAVWGGYSQKARVHPKAIVPLPAGMEPKHAMALGTAGFTAMLSVMNLQAHGVTPESGEVVVTGATGGVGSISIILLAKAGYEVVASSGKKEAYDYLTHLGASRIIDRAVLGDGPQSPLDKGKWAGAIDNVGGPALAALLSQMKRHGSVASCGLANSAALDTTVFPFILRGVNLLGIDTSTCARSKRIEAWEHLTSDMPRNFLDEITTIVPLKEVPQVCDAMMNSQIKGRYVVDLNS